MVDDYINMLIRYRSVCFKGRLDVMDYYVASRIRGSASYRWVCRDQFQEYSKLIWKELKVNPRIESDKKLYKFLEDFSEREFGTLTTFVYLNGFEKSYSEDEVTYLKNFVFNKGCEIVILKIDDYQEDEIKLLKMYFDSKDYKTLYQYLALKNIYTRGGVLLDHNLTVNQSFNYCSYYDIFFALAGIDTINDSVLGAGPGQDIIHELLDTYHKWEMYKNISLGKRIKYILSIKYNIKLNGKRESFLENNRGIIFEPSVFSYKNNKKNLDNIYIANYASVDNSIKEDYQYIHNSLIECIHLPTTASNNQMQQKYTIVEQELNTILNSDTYVVALYFKKIINAPILLPLKKMIKNVLFKLRCRK